MIFFYCVLVNFLVLCLVLSSLIIGDLITVFSGQKFLIRILSYKVVKTFDFEYSMNSTTLLNKNL